LRFCARLAQKTNNDKAAQQTTTKIQNVAIFYFLFKKILYKTNLKTTAV